MKLQSYLAAAATVFCLSCGGMQPRVAEEDFLSPKDYALLGDVDAALEELTDSLRADGDDPELHRRLAVCHRLKGTPEHRLLSLRHIERALGIDPDDPEYHVEKGLTLLAGGFRGGAERSLRKAAEIEPGSFAAWYNLGRIASDRYFESLFFESERRLAIERFRRARAADGSHTGTLYNLALLHLLAGDGIEALRISGNGLRFDPGDARLHLVRAAASVRLERFERADELFRRAFTLIDGELVRTYEDLRLLLPADRSACYLVLGDSLRSEFERKFWTMNDPTPSTVLNERRIEHYFRVFMARSILTSARLGREGVETDRGRALIKFGVPDGIDRDLGGGLYGPVLRWTYRTPGGDLVLTFMDEFLNGDYHIPIDPRFGGAADYTAGVMEGVTEMYEDPLTPGPVEAYHQASFLRGPEGRTTVEVSVATPCPGEICGGASVRMTLFDPDWRRMGTVSAEEGPGSSRMIERAGAVYAVICLGTEVVPRAGSCNLALEVETSHPDGRIVLRDRIEIPDFSGPRLRLGGPRFTLPGPDGRCGGILDPLPSYSDPSRTCVAVDVYGLEKGEDGLCRYRMTWNIRKSSREILEEDGFGRTLAYMRASMRGGVLEPDPFVSSSLEQFSSERSATAAVALDLSSLGNGRYVLDLEVEDLFSGATVSGSREFSVRTPEER